MARGAVEVAPRHYPLDRRGACGLADIALGLRARPAASTPSRLPFYLVLQGFAHLGDGDAGRALDDADHRAAERAAVSGAAPTAICRIPIMPWWPARSPCCRSCSACPGWPLIFTVLNAAVLAIRIRAENRALAISPCDTARDAHERGDAMSEPSPLRARRPSATWLGFAPDVPRHVHGDPRHSGGRDLAAGDPGRARDLARRDELDPDRVSDRRDHRDSADRLADARADVALAVRGRDRAVHRSPPSAARSAAISRR